MGSLLPKSAWAFWQRKCSWVGTHQFLLHLSLPGSSARRNLPTVNIAWSWCAPRSWCHYLILCCCCAPDTTLGLFRANIQKYLMCKFIVENCFGMLSTISFRVEL